MTETLTECTARALRQIATSIRLAVSEDEVNREDVRTAATQLEARAIMIEGGMG